MLEKYREVCENIVAAMPPGGIWQWEDRFGVALTVFEKADMNAVLPALERNFEHQWDAETVKTTQDAEVGTLIETLFGIEPGQLLFSRDAESGLLLFAAWWPWGNGVSISLRIGLFAAGGPAAGDPAMHIKEWFRL